MPTHTALTSLPGKAQAEALGDALDMLTPEPESIDVRDLGDKTGLWEVSACFAAAPDAAGLALLALTHGAKPFTVQELPETNWLARVRRELAPVSAGRFFIHGSHDADKVPDNRVALLVDAAMAFGTGRHGTTQGCLRALDRLASAGFVARCVADIGCGTGVLAMAAAKIWPGAVLAGDSDPVAVGVARTNLKLNGLAGRVECLQATGFDAPRLRSAAPFDLVFANILKGPLLDMATDMAEAVRAGGYGILSGILEDQAGEIRACYRQNGFDIADSERIGEWVTLVLCRN